MKEESMASPKYMVIVPDLMVVVDVMVTVLPTP